MLFLTQGKTNWKFLLIVVILLIIVGGGVSWFIQQQEAEIVRLIQSPEVVEPEKTAEDETADWETYRNEEYGFEVKYPSEITISSYGPNVAQQAINRGEQISGTVTPSLDTVVFSDDGGQLGAIGIFHKTEKDLTINNYDDGYLYLSGPCDLLWGFHPDNISLTSINDVTALIAEGEIIIDEEVVSYNHCYYLKNPDENLIVISNSGYKEDIFSQMLSTFRFIETISVWPEVESFDLTNKTFEGKIWASERKVRILTTDSTKFYSTSAPNWEKEYWTFPEFYSLLQNWTGPLWPFTVEGIYEGENTLRADEVSLIAQ
ncbi:MAG TPA: hypothetical protein VMV66_02910 [Candidatus Humimicrobiaceae bacterium]|nr:hypothetical protein [Candidatus Humimicrobiaceae bacterium]